MTEKRFKHSITLQGEDEIWDSQTDVYFRVCGALERLNELHEENIKIKKNCNRTHKDHTELLNCVSDLGYSVIIRNGKVVLER